MFFTPKKEQLSKEELKKVIIEALKEWDYERKWGKDRPWNNKINKGDP